MLCVLVIMAAHTSRAIVLQNNDLINKKSGLKVEGSEKNSNKENQLRKTWAMWFLQNDL